MHKLNLAYLHMLNNVWDIEDQLFIALPKLMEYAHDAELKKVLVELIATLRQHKERLEELFDLHHYSVTYERDMAFLTFTQDALSDLSLIDDQNVKDALLAASTQVIEHIKIARYRTLVTWAKELGDDTGHKFLKESLNEEEKISSDLFALAEGGLFNIGLNEKAAITGDI